MLCACEALSHAQPGHRPKLGFVAGYTFNDTAGLEFGLNTRTHYAGVEWSVPAYSGGLTTAKLKKLLIRLFKLKKHWSCFGKSP